MKIRKAVLGDKEQVAQVLTSFYNMDNLKEAERTFLNEMPQGHHYIIAEGNTKIVGLVTWLVHGLPKHELAELDRIVVLPEVKGKDIGKSLLDKLIKDANDFYRGHGFKLRKLYLLTHTGNKKAQAFYEKTGFKHEATLKNHYYEGKDEFVYSMFFD